MGQTEGCHVVGTDGSVQCTPGGSKGGGQIAAEPENHASVDLDPRHERGIGRPFQCGVEMTRGRDEVAAPQLRGRDRMFDPWERQCIRSSGGGLERTYRANVIAQPRP